ncbi:plasmid partitioning protein RepB [Sulfitobacter pseudonitzschiae]|nr:plasmid partitioning protein RepB [Pseudosulfitobacter pseudonitzschiae]MBM1834338.1 plasmid partitioning protein RepB [Pseudosulfitobacter pseudonitzschiae]MBM1839203.1 plasmid partitioning protein RepB [Pseudosulfitobacter pseudonitzschiae]MBM1844053.1 plasmid partitioning protein RepB [Pseudosulfitobacter pseudonitzschiae]MBM1848888.1 plasmid partitioning protein RepB [Pseudosulfitobacter pseudonitzschiae]
MGASLMARNIFNQPPKDETERAAPSPAPPKAAKLPGSVGGLRDSLREITANSIRDIDPDQIDMDGLRDRLVLEDSSIDELAESIRKHGQQVPIMVRPSAQPDRYRIVYGRRRLAAIRKTGGTVKAIVRTLDDDASLIAQGQENNLRLDPSFIEKSLFIKEMQEVGYKPGVIQDALGLTRQGVSNHRVVIEQLPDGLVQLIGPAHGIGRRQWGDLAALSAKVDLMDIAKETLAALPDDTPSSDKFQAVYSASSRKKARGDKKPTTRDLTTIIKDKDGNSLATLTVADKAIAIKVTKKDNPEFSQWLEERVEATLLQLFDQWRNERGTGS